MKNGNPLRNPHQPEWLALGVIYDDLNKYMSLRLAHF